MERRRGGLRGRRPFGLEEFEIAQIMDRIRGGVGGQSLPSGDVDMEARNSRIQRGGEVPGLPGVHFSPDMATASRKAAESVQKWNSSDRMSHPAIGWSRQMAGGGVGQSAIKAMEPRLAEKGIYRDSSGTWKIGGMPQTGPSTAVPAIGQSRPAPGTPSTANGGTVNVGDIAGNVKAAIDVSGGTQINNNVVTPGKTGTVVTGSPNTAPSQLPVWNLDPAPTASHVTQDPRNAQLSPGLGGTPPIPEQPASSSPMGGGIRGAIMAGIEEAMRMPTTGASGSQPVPNTPVSTASPAMNVTAPAASPSGAAPGSSGMGMAAQQIITQETGGQDLTGQTNCTIRPGSGCLALNSGIFEVTAQSIGMDFNRIVNDPAYAAQAVETLLGNYAQDDASKWNGPSGMTVWEYGQQNLPGGGMEAIARVYFGGDVTGQYVDEQGRSGATYGQQFMDKMYSQGYDPATAAPPGQSTSGGYMHPETLSGIQQTGVPPAATGSAPTTGGIGSPQGTIRTDVIGYGTGGDWANYNAYDPQFTKYGQQFGVDPAILKGMMIVESGGAAGTPDNGWGNGVMQVQPEWQAEADRLGLPPINTDEGQIAMAAAILGGYASLGQPTVKGDWETNFRNIFFPSPVELRTGSGITQDQYVQAVNTLAGDIHAAGGTQPSQPGLAPSPQSGSQGELTSLLPTIQGPTPGGTGNNTGIDPTTGLPVGQPPILPGSDRPMAATDTAFGPGANRKMGDPTAPAPVSTEAPGSLGDSTSEPRPPAATQQMDVVAMPSGGVAAAPGTDESWMVEQAGGADAPITSEYKGGVVGPWYDYQVGHGASASEHAGYDIGYVRGTEITATPMLTGTVECTACGSYCTGGVTADGGLYCDGVGVGEIRVSLDPANHGGQQITMLYGHMLTSSVQPGQTVGAGQPIGQTGYAGTGDHLHQEAWGHCPGYGYAGDYRYLDPTLVANGYYQTHSTCTDEPL